MIRLLFAACVLLAASVQAEACLPSDIRAQLSRMSHCGIKIGSTFRRNAVIAGTGRRSYHASCRAVDFHARDRGCAMRALAGWKGGVITYSGGHNHIHIDNGPRLRAHNGGGARRYYAGKRSKHRRYRTVAHARHASPIQFLPGWQW
jgi:hypothetical protein